MAGPGASLPPRFAIFPLRGCLLLPGGNLPLNIFEPRYLAMVRDAMQADRVIGMVQPREPNSRAASPPVFRTGCAGRISNFAETEDGRYLITLTGLCRFDIVEELPTTTPYRQVRADYDPWRGDLRPRTPDAELKGELLGVLRLYFQKHGIEADWAMLETAPVAALITSLAMICPFGPAEKQALLEASDLDRQGRLLVALMRIETMPGAGTGSATKH